MERPSTAQLIGAWEMGMSRNPLDRALTLLAVACPEMTVAQIAALPVGRRDALLLELRQSLFGPALNCYAECPRCQARLEFRADVGEILGRGRENQNPRRELVCGGVRLRYRAPDSGDLTAVSQCGDVVAARRLLLERCVLEVTRGGAALAMDDISAPALDELSSQLCASENCADISFALGCTACAYSWELAFDIASFLWSEVSLLAKSYLYEVHALAWAYGWREADILAMTPARRRFYLDRVDG